METKFNPNNIKLTNIYSSLKKGCVSKASIACATAVSLADQGHKSL